MAAVGNIFLLLISSFLFSLPTTDTSAENMIPIRPERPIIGILAQKITDKLLHKFYPYTKKRSYIATSYVKFLQSAGARVVPILDTYDDANLTKIFRSINGILLPGGGVNLKNSKFFKTGKKLFKMAVDVNHKGGYFPIMGICLGFEAIHHYVEGKQDFLSKYNVENQSLPITLDSTYKTSRMFYNLTKQLKDSLQKQALTSNFHHDGVDPSWYKKSKKLKKDFRLLATSKDRDGKTFVSAFEGIRYPFYGTQFHPEKPAFEWHPTLDIKHTSDAVKIGQYLVDFFVDETRKNDNKFESYAEEIQYIIDRYPPLYTAFNVDSKMPFDGIYVL